MPSCISCQCFFGACFTGRWVTNPCLQEQVQLIPDNPPQLMRPMRGNVARCELWCPHSIQKLFEFVKSIQIKPASVEECLWWGLLVWKSRDYCFDSPQQIKRYLCGFQKLSWWPSMVTISFFSRLTQLTNESNGDTVREARIKKSCKGRMKSGKYLRRRRFA